MDRASASGTGLSPTVEPVPVSPPDGASIPDADDESSDEMQDAVNVYHGSVRQLWRAIQRDNRCVQAVCSDIKGENCVCNAIFEGFMEWANEDAQ